MTPHLARILGEPPRDRRWSWVLDGTLIPTRDHAAAARSKNYRYSCNAQVLIRRRDRRVVAVSAGGPGNHNVSGALPGRKARSPVPRTWPRARGWWISRHPRARDPALSRPKDGARPGLAATPKAAGTRRACPREAQGLESPPRPQAPRQARPGHRRRRRRTPQPTPGFAGQLLVTVDVRLDALRDPITEQLCCGPRRALVDDGDRQLSAADVVAFLVHEACLPGAIDTLPPTDADRHAGSAVDGVQRENGVERSWRSGAVRRGCGRIVGHDLVGVDGRANSRRCIGLNMRWWWR